MKNVHFTIDLKAGISITGNNPADVLEMLYMMHTAFYKACEDLAAKKLFATREDYDKWFWAIDEAIDTIQNSYKTKED